MTANINFADMNWWVLTPELVLLATAFSLLILGLKKDFDSNAFLSKASIIGVGISLIVSFILWGQVPSVLNNENPAIFSSALINDRFAQTFNIIFLLMSLFAIFATFRFPKSDHENKPEYFALVLLAVVGMMFLAKSGTMIAAFVSLELFSIALYILCGFSAKHGTGIEGPGDYSKLSWECKTSQESAIKYFLTGAFASAVLIYGMALIYAGTGTTEIHKLAEEIHNNPYSSNLLVYMGIALLFAGLAFKVSLVPFHSWTPDVYQGSPTPITGFMSVATKAAAFAFIGRIFYGALPELQSVWMPFLFGISVITMLVGNTAAIFQTNVKRMLAYSGIAHAGYLLIGIVANNQEGMASVIFYLGIYLCMNLGAFAIVYILEGEGEEANSINRFKGLAKRNPYLAFAMALFMASLAGFPPTAGFFAKFYLFISAIKEGYELLAILAVVASMISVYFYLRIIVLMYFRESSESEDSIEITTGMGALIAFSSAAILMIGIFPSGFMHLALSSIPF
jgi:NADH-quinone oxidoreductase subunit N